MNEKNVEQKKAIALRYAESDQAPIVLAKGTGKAAEKILEKAEENNIPVQQDPTLAELLGQLNINEAIPEELYGAVAEVLAFIYQIDKKTGESK